MAHEMTMLTQAEYRACAVPFIRRHHYTGRCSPIALAAYGLRNSRGALCGVASYGPPPAAGMDRDLVGAALAPRLIWQQRLVAKGVTSADVARLMEVAARDLARRGYAYIYTMTEPRAHVIDGVVRRQLARLEVRGYTGEQYARGGWLYCGDTTPHKAVALWLVDGTAVHVRQGRRTLSARGVRAAYPNAREIRAVAATPKARWVAILAGSAAEERSLVAALRYPPRTPHLLIQPRLLTKAQGVHAR